MCYFLADHRISLTTVTISFIVEIAKVQSMGRLPSRDQKYVDIYREKPMKVSVKVLVPVREHPKVKQIELKVANVYCFVFSLILWVNYWDQKATR